MGVTYTTAGERDTRRHRVAIERWQVVEPLAAVSILAALLVLLALAGRFSVTSRPDAAINLNTVADAQSLEAALAPLFEAPADARLAARELFGFIAPADRPRRALANVGAVSRARIPLHAIDASPGAVHYRLRAAEERAHASSANRPIADSVTLLTSQQLAQLKPFLIVRQGSDVRIALFFWAALYLAAFHAVSMVWRRRGVPGDRVLLAVAHMLTAVGFAVMVSRPDPLRDVLLFVRFAQGVCIGLGIAVAVSLVNLRTSHLSSFSFLPLLGAVALSIVLMAFGSGPTGSNAKVNLGPVQPIEAIRLLLALFLAGYFARNWEILRGVREQAIGTLALPRWVNLPRVRYALPVLLGVGLALALFFLQRDLGPALMLAIVFLATWGIARGRPGMVLAGGALLLAGFYVGYRLEISTTLAARVRIWQSPWDNAARGGDQIAHALWAASTGGPLGAGLGLGDPRYVPAGDTDLVLAAIAEELGIAGVVGIALLLAAVTARAMATARRASTDYGFFLATILGLFFAVPALLMAAGILGVIPLTGVVTPFLSFGGSAMVANFAAVGLLAAIRSDTRPAADLEIFRRSLRWVGGALLLAAAVLVAVAVRVQVVDADEIAVRPHLGIQADGGRRFQYNPRVLDTVRLIPRGSVVDRQGLALATDDETVLAKSGQVYEKLGISLRSSCANRTERCYPLGGRAFHLLGDVNSRRNWSATNTSFVERDSEARLRGFDDHQTMVRTVEGSESWTVRRDYSELLPILRHRRQPEHREVKAITSRPRDVRLTIDARLQWHVAEILARHIARSGSGRAAAVVLDPATGDLLASAAYPWPQTPQSREPSEEPPDALLDRARYGLYPPGSTFKLVTAAAAFMRDPVATRRTFQCTRLDDGRVGARITGWGRPIRDDVLDKTPHGAVDMREAIVVSCNAYFAQLAVALGAGAMTSAAERAGVSLAPNNSPARIRDTLPQVGYGQGDVLASPLRMARIPAAVAAEGTIREVRMDRDTAAAKGRELLTPNAARQLASFMRDAVLGGTGRSLRGASVAVAGKTGTAEVAGAASHAWFIGFAPYGASKARVAVAVIIENAGYGGTAAAPAAGEIISAASALGLAR